MNCIICGAEYQEEHEHRPGLCEKCVSSVTDFDYTNALKAQAAPEEPPAEEAIDKDESGEAKEKD